MDTKPKTSWTVPVLTALATVGAFLHTSPEREKTDPTPLNGPHPQVHGAMPFSCCQSSGDLDNMVENSDLIFRGTVMRVDYANSTPSGEGNGAVPHTFVTYSVQEVLSGEDPGPHLTLRFLGGHNPVTGRYTRTTIAPQFDVGDDDILFVAGNGERLSPLVENRSGRLRVIGGQVYSDTGRSVRLHDGNHVQLGARYPLEEVRTTRIQGELIETQRSSNLATGPSDAMPPQELLASIRYLGRPQGATARRFRSVYPWVPFAGPDHGMTIAPVEPAQELQPESLEEQQQRALAREQEEAVRASVRRTETRNRPSRPSTSEPSGSGDSVR